MPTVSVIIPTYNRSQYIIETLESVFEQSYSDYEIVVINDGSTDDTEQILTTHISSGSIRYFYQDNQGESAARNHGIRVAQGKYIAFLDSDDLILPTKLEKQVDFLENHPEIGFVHSNFVRFNDRGDELGLRETSHLTGWVYPEYLLNWSVLLPPSTVMVRADVLSEVGGFLVGMRWGPDLDMWRRITKNYPIGAIPEALTKMRAHSGNVSANKVDAVASFERYLQRAFDDDHQLNNRFRRRVLAKMYSNAGHNILAEGIAEQMSDVRKFSLKAIQNWPFQWSAYLGWVATFLGPQVRGWLLKFWRNIRYNQ